jgi:hypothetical protein
MNPKDNHETNDQSIIIEDLSAETTEANNVKGGPYKVVLEDCLVSSWQSGG